MSLELTSNLPWWQLRGRDLGEALKSVVERLERDQAWRKSDALRRYSVYYGRQISSLQDLERGFFQSSGTLQFGEEDYGPDITYCKSAINTCTARIAGPIRPKPVVLTEGADYSTRLNAKRLSKFIEGQFQESQGAYSTIYDLGADVFRDSMITDGVVKVEADTTNGKVSVSRLFIWDLYFDELDARSGRPTQIYQRTTPDRHQLIAKYPKCKYDILEAKSPEELDTRLSPGDDRRVVVWECYVLPTAPDEVGKRVTLLGSTVLEESDYEHDTFPFAFQLWDRAPVGVRGNPPIDFAAKSQRIANKLLDYCLINTQALAGGWIVTEKGAFSQDALESNDPVKLLEYTTQTPGQSPQVYMPSPFNPQVLDLAERARQQVFEIFGVSELAAQSRREPGLTSGVALRNMTDLQDKRFLPQARQLEQFYIDVGKLMLRAVIDLDKQGIKPKSFLPSGGFLESIDWQRIEIGEKSLYQVQVQAGSALTDTLGARLQFISELQQSGALDPQTASRLLASDNPDLEAATARKHAQYNWIERIIFEIHDADPEEDPDVEPLDPLMDLPSAVNQLIDAYLECSSWPDTPETKRRALRTLIQQGVELIQRQTPPQPPAAPPGALPPPEQPPQAPPMAV